MGSDLGCSREQVELVIEPLLLNRLVLPWRINWETRFMSNLRAIHSRAGNTVLEDCSEYRVLGKLDAHSPGYTGRLTAKDKEGRNRVQNDELLNQYGR